MCEGGPCEGGVCEGGVCEGGLCEGGLCVREGCVRVKTRLPSTGLSLTVAFCLIVTAMTCPTLLTIKSNLSDA